MKKMGLYITIVMLLFLCACGVAAEPKPTDALSTTSVITPSESADASVSPSIAPAEAPSASPKESLPVAEPDETVNIAGLFSFGMTSNEVYDLLLANGFKREEMQGTAFDCLLDNRQHEVLDAGDHAFTFDAKDASGKLYAFWTSTASTARGFVPGEDKQRMIELYGDNYKEYEFDNATMCEYDFGEYCLDFYVHYDTDKIETWEITSYSYEERMMYYQS